MEVMRNFPAEIRGPQWGVGDLDTLGKYTFTVNNDEAYKSNDIANPFALRKSAMSAL